MNIAAIKNLFKMKENNLETAIEFLEEAVGSNAARGYNAIPVSIIPELLVNYAASLRPGPVGMELPELYEKCEDCGGSGAVYEQDSNGDPCLERCFRCKGEGYIPYASQPAPSRDGWISVEDKKPAEEQEVLCCQLGVRK